MESLLLIVRLNKGIIYILTHFVFILTLFIASFVSFFCHVLCFLVNSLELIKKKKTHYKMIHQVSFSFSFFNFFF